MGCSKALQFQQSKTMKRKFSSMHDVVAVEKHDRDSLSLFGVVLVNRVGILASIQMLTKVFASLIMP